MKSMVFSKFDASRDILNVPRFQTLSEDIRVMQIFKEIKLFRLVLTIAITLFMADKVPHPSLSNGLLKNSLGLMQGEPATASSLDTAIAARN